MTQQHHRRIRFILLAILGLSVVVGGLHITEAVAGIEIFPTVEPGPQGYVYGMVIGTTLFLSLLLLGVLCI